MSNFIEDFQQYEDPKIQSCLKTFVNAYLISNYYQDHLLNYNTFYSVLEQLKDSKEDYSKRLHFRTKVLIDNLFKLNQQYNKYTEDLSKNKYESLDEVLLSILRTENVLKMFSNYNVYNQFLEKFKTQVIFVKKLEKIFKEYKLFTKDEIKLEYKQLVIMLKNELNDSENKTLGKDFYIELLNNSIEGISSLEFKF